MHQNKLPNTIDDCHAIVFADEVQLFNTLDCNFQKTGQKNDNLTNFFHISEYEITLSLAL